MKRWPLRWKIAIYAAGLGIAATIAGAGTTWIIMHYWELAAFDRRLASDAEELFRDIEHFKTNPVPNQNGFSELLVPLALRQRFIQIVDANRKVIYLSPNLPGPVLDDGIEQPHSKRIDGTRVRLSAFHHDGLTAFIGADVRETQQIGRDIILGMIGAIPTVLVVAAIGGRWVARRALGPVDAIRQAAARITPRNLHERLPSPQSRDEIAGLVNVLNNTFDRLERSFEQAMRFSADASHHLKTPLQILRAGIEEILSDPNTPAKQQDRADALLHQVHQLTSISENLLLLARADAGRLEVQREEVNLETVLDGICDDVRALAESEGITVEVQTPARLLALGDRRWIGLTLQNLVENAMKYNVPNGSICVQAQDTGSAIEISIRNSGPPIPAERIPHIFERFYRARSDARIFGSGLGLSIARELTTAQGGELNLVRSDSQWTEFLLRLPSAGTGVGSASPTTLTPSEAASVHTC